VARLPIATRKSVPEDQRLIFDEMVQWTMVSDLPKLHNDLVCS